MFGFGWAFGVFGPLGSLRPVRMNGIFGIFETFRVGGWVGGGGGGLPARGGNHEIDGLAVLLRPWTGAANGVHTTKMTW